jgi:putative ABC transport system permease protein
MDRFAGTLLRNLRYAARDLVRNRSFTAAALLALTLGIGACTAIFSVVDRILFRSLPYRQAERLVSVGMFAPILPEEFLLGYDYVDWRAAKNSPFESMGAMSSGLYDCDLNDARPARLRCGRADADLLRTLGTGLVAGREFTRADERLNAPPIAMVAYSLWRSRLGGDGAAVGRTITVDGNRITVVGVLPANFEAPTLERPDILFPQTLDDPEQQARRRTIPLYCVGRLKPGTGPRQAAAALRPLFDQAMQAVPANFRKDVTLGIRSVRDRQIHDAKLTSWVLLAAVLAVMLIACANVANLMLARASARERDLAVRMALGAGRIQLAGQALTESALVALCGGAAGAALAFGLLRVLTAIAPADIPRLNEASVDVRVLLFTAGVSLLCGLLFGLAPALDRPRVEPLGGGRSAAGGRYRLRQGLVAAQVCVSLVLLTGAGLLMKTLWNLQRVPLGMKIEGTVTASVTLGRTAYGDPARRVAYFDAVEEHLRRIPGVEEVAISDSLPPSNSFLRTTIYGAIDVEGHAQFTDGTGGPVAWRAVTPEYFAALRIPIRRGRAFQEQDRDVHVNVVVLSEMLARRMFPGQDPIGQRIRPGRMGAWLSVVGVAADVKNGGLAEAAMPEFYVPRKNAEVAGGWNGQIGYGANAIVRTPGDPRAVAPWVRSALASVDSTLPITVETMEQQVGKLAAGARFHASLLGAFAGLALLLAAIGLYGVMSYLVEQRSAEIGVRMALGATPAAIARQVLGEAARWVLAGAAAGIAASVWAARLIDRMLFHAAPHDPATLVAASAVLLAVALVASWVPSRRAAGMDPMKALRGE